jgi:hypothetical protein
MTTPVLMKGAAVRTFDALPAAICRLALVEFMIAHDRGARRRALPDRRNAYVHALLVPS